MGKTFNDIKVPFIKEGIIREAEIANTITTTDCVELAVNFHFDSLGALTRRYGLTQYGDIPSANPILSYGSFAQNASTNRRLLIQIGGTIYSNNAGTSTSVRTGLSATNKARYTQFTNLTYMVNGNSTAGGAAVQTFNGTAFGTTNVASLPAGDYIETFGGRIWIADKSTDRLYYSEIVDPTGTITGGTDYISKLSPQDGESITALKTISQAMLVFKQNQIFRVYSAESLDPYPAYNVGTFSQESLISAKSGLYFHHSSGFYRLVSYDTKPVEISRRISDIVSAIPRANYENIFGWRSEDGNNLYWHVGDLTLKGITYSSVVLRYNISYEIWTVYSYRKTLSAAIVFDNGTTISPYVGTSLGVTAKVDVGNTDLGDPIFYEEESHWISFTDTFSRVKRITDIAAYHENAAGTLLQYKTDADPRNVWINIGTLDSQVVKQFGLSKEISFNRFKYRFSGESSGDPCKIYGIEVLSLQDEGYKEQ